MFQQQYQPVQACRAAHLKSCRPTAAHRRASAMAAGAVSSKQAAESGTVISHLLGKKVLQLSPGHAAVPLLHPMQHSLPFAVSLHIYNGDSTTSTSTSSSSNNLSSRQDNPLVELYYVISGSGHFCSSSGGQQQALQPGDSIIAMQGSATFAAGPLTELMQLEQQQTTPQQQQQQQQQEQEPSMPAWSQLVSWLRHAHGKTQEQQQQHEASSKGLQAVYDHHRPWAAAPPVISPNVSNQHSPQQHQQRQPQQQHQSQQQWPQQQHQQQQLVMLQLLLPAELLTGELLSHHAGHFEAVARHLPWAPAVLTTQHSLRISHAGSYDTHPDYQQQQQQHLHLQLPVQDLAAAAAARGGGSGHHMAAAEAALAAAGVTPAGSIGEEEVCSLLVGASLAAGTPPAAASPAVVSSSLTGAPVSASPGLPTAATEASQPQPQQHQLHEQEHKGPGPQHHLQQREQHGSNSNPAGTVTSTIIISSSSSNSPTSDSKQQLGQQQMIKRALSEVGAFRLPHQTNRLALLFGPHASPAVSCSFGVEVFEPHHVTPLHIHTTAHELFFVLAGNAEAVFGSNGSNGSNGGGWRRRVELSAGDVAVFPPGVLHGIDNPSSSGQLYCLQMMLPNEAFVEFVRSGELVGGMDVAALQRMAAAAASCG